MDDNHVTRDSIIKEWYFQDWIGDSDHLPSSEDVFIFMKIMIDTISLFGKLSKQERKYVIGRAAILGRNRIDSFEISFYCVGVTQELLDELQRYEPDASGDITKAFDNFDQVHVKKTRMGILYNSFRMLSIGHPIHREELDGIHLIANKLGVTKEQVQQIKDLFDEEEKIRQKRAKLLFPKGFNDALIEYQKLH